MAVVNSASGRPILELFGGARERLAEITPNGLEAVVHLTMTDDPPLAQAMVLIEALPNGVAAPQKA